MCQKEATKTLEQIESDVRNLSPQEQEQLHDWLENLLEDRLELSEEFRAEIEAGKKDIAEGRYRVRKRLPVVCTPLQLMGEIEYEG